MENELSIAERVIEAAVCRLREVVEANGFRTNAGLRVFRARRSVSLTELPCFVVWEGDEASLNDTGSGARDSMSMQLAVRVSAFVKAGQADTGRMLGLVKADAKKALLINKGEIAGGCAIAYRSATPSPREDGDESESVDLNFEVTYQEGYGDPYASR